MTLFVTTIKRVSYDKLLASACLNNNAIRILAITTNAIDGLRARLVGEQFPPCS
jgi:hypothetical protein